MWFDRKKFRRNACEVLDDIEDGEIRSKSWAWIAGGAIVGFISSCVKLTRSTGKPILAKFSKSLKNNSKGRF
jgi:hypothetical protein